MGPLNEMNAETVIWYHGEFVHSLDHYNLIEEGVPLYRPYFSRWVELVQPASPSFEGKRTPLSYQVSQGDIESLVYMR